MEKRIERTRKHTHQVPTLFVVRIFIFGFNSLLKNTLSNNLFLKLKVRNYSTFPDKRRRIAIVCPFNNLFSPIKKHISSQ